MGCHQTVKADSPHIQKVAAAARDKKPIPWVRVYRIPTYVTSVIGCTLKQAQHVRPATDRFASATSSPEKCAMYMRSCMACHCRDKGPQ